MLPMRLPIRRMHAKRERTKHHPVARSGYFDVKKTSVWRRLAAFG